MGERVVRNGGNGGEGKDNLADEILRKMAEDIGKD